MAYSLPLSYSYAKRASKETKVAKMYRINGHPTIGGTITRGLAKHVLICSNAF